MGDSQSTRLTCSAFLKQSSYALAALCAPVASLYSTFAVLQSFLFAVCIWSVPYLLQFKGCRSNKIGRLCHLRIMYCVVYIDALPLVSYGRRSAKQPAEITRPPAMYTGAVVMILAYSAIIGAITPEIRVAVHTNPFPVPRSFAGNISEEIVWRTPYIMLLLNTYPQFHPSKALELRAVVLANRKAPVSPDWVLNNRNRICNKRLAR